MYVHINVVRRQVDHHGPTPPYAARLGRRQSRAHSGVLYAPPVDEEHHDDAPASRESDSTRDGPRRPPASKRNRKSSSASPSGARCTRRDRRGGGIFENFASLFLHAEGDFGVYKGVVVDYLYYAAQLRRGALQKFAPRRQVEEKVVYLYPRPGLRGRL